MDRKGVRETEFLNKCNHLFREYKKRVFSLSRDTEITNYSKEFYNGLKELASYYYPGEKIPFDYRYLAQEIFLFERFLPTDSIFPFEGHDFSKVLDRPKTKKKDEAVLDYLVDQTRNYLFDEVSLGREYYPYETYDLQDKCVKAVDFLMQCAYEMGIKYRRFIIYPCFKRDNGVMNAVHAFLLVKLNGKTYLIDCTYSQFCSFVRCDLNRIGVPLFAGPAPGAFMQYDDSHREVALTLLNRGWIEYTDETIKAYLDGFLLSYRNGLFYERTNDFSFISPYTALDYEHFFYGEDDLFHYEKKEELGYQLKPLSNPHMLIKHR